LKVDWSQIPSRRLLASGPMGIAREDKKGRKVAVMRNFEFFRAPCPALFVCTGTLVVRTPSAWGCSCKRCCWPWPHEGWVPPSRSQSRGIPMAR